MKGSDKSVKYWAVAIVVFVVALIVIGAVTNLHNTMLPEPSTDIIIEDNEADITVDEQPTEEIPWVVIDQNGGTISQGVDCQPMSLEKQVFELINQERSQRHLRPLYYEDRLQNAANIRAQECSELFSHTRPDGSPCYFVFEDDVDCFVSGENLLMGPTNGLTAEKMVSSWMDSEGHRENILLSAFRGTAIGIFEKDGTTYAAQIFIG